MEIMPRHVGEVKNLLPGQSKPDLRRWALERRARLDVGALSAALVAHVSAWLATLPPSTVLAYRAMAGELSIDGVVAADERHAWAVTRTPPRGPLSVHRWDAPLEQHRYGFEQPVAAAPEIAAADIDIVLVPGLLFDGRGGRLGYGKGYYDQLLATMVATTTTIGITCTALTVAAVPIEGHDVPMTHLADEVGIRAVASDHR